MLIVVLYVYLFQFRVIGIVAMAVDVAADHDAVWYYRI